MKKFLTILTLLAFSCTVFAAIPEKRIKNLPQGTFRKTRNGTIVQYDKNGKKVGVYKVNSGKYVKTK